MTNTIFIVFTDKHLSMEDLHSVYHKKYAFFCSHELEIGDLLTSPKYNRKMQVVDIKLGASWFSYKGNKIKYLSVKNINDKEAKEVDRNRKELYRKEQEEKIKLRGGRRHRSCYNNNSDSYYDLNSYDSIAEECFRDSYF